MPSACQIAWPIRSFGMPACRSHDTSTRHPRPLISTAKGAGRHELEAEAVASATKLLAAQSWQDPRIWTGNRPHMRKLLGWTAAVTSDSDVRMTLTTAINQDPQLLPAVLLGMAQWSEHHNAIAFDQILDVNFGIETLPSWFPTETFAATIRRSLPHVEPADEDDSARYNDDVDRLTSQVLWLAESKWFSLDVRACMQR